MYHSTVLRLSFKISTALHITSSCLSRSHFSLHATLCKSQTSYPTILGFSPTSHPLKNILQNIEYPRYYSSARPKQTYKHSEYPVSFQHNRSLNRLRVNIRGRWSRQYQQVFNPDFLISNISLDIKNDAHSYVICKISEHLLSAKTPPFPSHSCSEVFSPSVVG
jgi:hypothetical protein